MIERWSSFSRLPDHSTGICKLVYRLALRLYMYIHQLHVKIGYVRDAVVCVINEIGVVVYEGLPTLKALRILYDFSGIKKTHTERNVSWLYLVLCLPSSITQDRVQIHLVPLAFTSRVLFHRCVYCCCRSAVLLGTVLNSDCCVLRQVSSVQLYCRGFKTSLIYMIYPIKWS